MWQDIDDSVDFRVLSSEKLQEILQFRIGQLKSFDEIRDAVEEFVESVVLYAGLSISHTYAFRDCWSLRKPLPNSFLMQISS